LVNSGFYFFNHGGAGSDLWENGIKKYRFHSGDHDPIDNHGGFLVLLSLSMNKFKGFSFKSLASSDWALIFAAGIAGALSWLFYFMALKTGDVVPVVAIDRLSLVFVAMLAAIFLGEHFGLKTAIGTFLMISGAIIINLK